MNKPAQRSIRVDSFSATRYPTGLLPDLVVLKTIKNDRESILSATYLKQWCLFLATLLLSFSVYSRQSTVSSVPRVITIAALPHEARQTLALIRRGPPFPYAKDGAVFGNYEGLLPKQPRGYYHEFTVKTPGSRNRGAQRLVVGGVPVSSNEIYYTADHYSSFSRVRE